MSAKEVKFSVDARDRMLHGIDTLTHAVRVTLGPKGRNVLLDKSFGAPRITKDGVTVAKEIELEDKFENMPCCRIQRRRARAISARFCSVAYKVFFEADVPALEEPPHCAAATWDAFFPHGRNDFIQR